MPVYLLSFSFLQTPNWTIPYCQASYWWFHLNYVSILKAIFFSLYISILRPEMVGGSALKLTYLCTIGTQFVSDEEQLPTHFPQLNHFNSLPTPRLRPALLQLSPRHLASIHQHSLKTLKGFPANLWFSLLGRLDLQKPTTVHSKPLPSHFHE